MEVLIPIPGLVRESQKWVWNHFLCQKLGTHSYNDGIMSKGYSGQFEGVPYAQIWDNLGIIITNSISLTSKHLLIDSILKLLSDQR